MSEERRREGEEEKEETHLVLPMNFWPSERLNWGLSLRHCTRRLPRKLDMSAAASVSVSSASRSFTTGAAADACVTS